MYFSFFKLKKWGKKTAETRRRNCAVLPSAYYTGFSELCNRLFFRAVRVLTETGKKKRETLCITEENGESRFFLLTKAVFGGNMVIQSSQPADIFSDGWPESFYRDASAATIGKKVTHCLFDRRCFSFGRFFQAGGIRLPVCFFERKGYSLCV